MHVYTHTHTYVYMYVGTLPTHTHNILTGAVTVRFNPFPVLRNRRVAVCIHRHKPPTRASG